MKARFVCAACVAALLMIANTAVCEKAVYPFGEVTRDQIIDKHLGDRTLQPVEGIWKTDDGKYEVAIIRNTSPEYQGYDYLGIIAASLYNKFKPGLAKVLMKKTATDKVFSGIWFMLDFTNEDTAFTLSADGCSIECVRGKGAETKTKTQLLRTWPSCTTSDPSAADVLSGTGFLVSPQLIITSCHVVGEALSVGVVTHDGTTHKAAVVARDFANDLALLKATDWTSEAYIHLANPSDVVQGARVYTIGYPLAQDTRARATLGDGLINGITGLGDDPRMFQISISVQPGNSGGPLLDTRARAIGVVTSTLNSVYLIMKTRVIPQNVNFAMKINYIDNLIAVSRERIPEGTPPPTELDAAGVAERAQKAVVRIVGTVAGS